jgi:hypothetical protein
MEGVMFNSWVRTPEIVNGLDITGATSATLGTNITSITLGTTITVVATKTFVGASTTLAANTAFQVGHVIVLEGFPTAANNGVPKILTAVTTTTLVASAAAFSNEASTVAGGANTRGSRIKVVGLQGVAADINATASGLSSTTMNFTNMNLAVGMWVKIYGFTTTATANNGYARISAIAATSLTFDILPAGWTTKTETAAVGMYYGDYIKNGVTDVSYSMEVQYELNVPTFVYYRGQKPATYSLQADSQQIVTETVTFQGLNALDPTATRGSSNFRGSAVTFGTPTTVASQGYSVFDSSNAVPFVLIGGAAISGGNFVNGFSMQLENNLRAQNAIGSVGAVGIGAGRVNITGNLNTYFGTTAEYIKVTQNTATSVTLGFQDNAFKKGILIDMPRIKYSGGQPDVTGIDTDIFLDVSFQALRDLAGGRDYTLFYQKFDYIV